MAHNFLDKVLVVSDEEFDQSVSADDSDLSERRDEEVRALLAALPALQSDDSNFIKREREPKEFLKQDFYLVYNGARILGDRALTPKIDIASGVVRRPIAVFRDVVTKVDSRESSYLEYFYGLTRWADGTPALTLVLNHRNVMVKVFMARGDAGNRELLNQTSGLLVFSRF